MENTTVDILLYESVAGTNYAYGKGLNHDVPIAIARDLVRAGHAIYADQEFTSPVKPENAKSKQAAKAQKRK